MTVRIAEPRFLLVPAEKRVFFLLLAALLLVPTAPKAGLGSPSSSRKAEHWIEKLNHLQVATRLEAREQLLAMGPEASGPLLAALDSPQWRTRQSAVWLLGEIGERSVAPRIILLVQNTASSDVDRFLGVGALEKLGGAEAEAALETALEDPSPSIRNAASAVLAARKREKKDLSKLEGKSCVLHYSCADDDAARVLDWAERAYERFREWSDLREPGRRPTTVKIFGTPSEFENYGSRTLYNFHTYSQFYYSFFFDEIVLYVDGDGRINRRWFIHEAFHGFLARQIPIIPSWVNEGLAECFEVAIDRNGGWDPAQLNPEWPPLLKDAAQRSKAVPLSRLVRMDANTFYGEERMLHYAQSWLLCHYLLNGDGRRYRYILRRYLRELAQGRDGEDALRAAFHPLDFEQLELRVDRYLAGL